MLAPLFAGIAGMSAGTAAVVGAGISAGASLIGGVMNNSAKAAADERNNQAAREQADQQYQNDLRTAETQRQWNLEDRDESRAYNITQRDEARAYDIAQRDEARGYSRKVLGHLVEDAEAAGFNPLTILRNGGGAGYNAAASFQPALSQWAAETPLSRTAPTRQAPLMRYGANSMGDAVAAAGNRIGDFIADFDPFADDKRELEAQLVGAQIANLNASTGRLRSQSFDVPAATVGTGRTVTTQKAGQLSGLPIPRTIETPGSTNPWPTGSGIKVDTRLADAQNWEDRYGELPGWVAGGANLVWDLAGEGARWIGIGTRAAMSPGVPPSPPPLTPFRPYIDNLPSISGR